MGKIRKPLFFFPSFWVFLNKLVLVQNILSFFYLKSCLFHRLVKICILELYNVFMRDIFQPPRRPVTSYYLKSKSLISPLVAITQSHVGVNQLI